MTWINYGYRGEDLKDEDGNKIHLSKNKDGKLKFKTITYEADDLDIDFEYEYDKDGNMLGWKETKHRMNYADEFSEFSVVKKDRNGKIIKIIKEEKK